ncbi:MAG: hypothetical protein IPN81_00135 [Nitrosomonadales bacterium]|nr:hypothetical protein [Nitrosomonadales bacterium]
MDKLIDHARAVHLTLIGVCAVVVVFASTGDTPREAREAIRALEQIQHLDIDAFSKSVTATLRQHLDRDGFSAGLKRVSEATGVPIELTNVEFDETAGVKDLATAIKSKTLLELREYLTKDHPVTVEMPDAPALFAILTTALPQFKPVRRMPHISTEASVQSSSGRWPALSPGLRRKRGVSSNVTTFFWSSSNFRTAQLTVMSLAGARSRRPRRAC